MTAPHRESQPVIERAVEILRRRAAGYEARATATFSGRIMADELRANAREIEALADTPPQCGVQITDAAGIEWFERTFGVPLGDMPGAGDVDRVRASVVSSATGPAAALESLAQQYDDTNPEVAKRMRGMAASVSSAHPASTPEQAAEAMANCPYWNGEKSLSGGDK